MNDTLFAKLQNFRVALNNAHLERSSIIDGLLATIISKQNAFLLGLPGTGKSDLIRSICSGIEGVNYFGYLLSPTTDPSELFGPVAVTKLLNDEYTRDVDGYLPSAHVAFLDELFRGSSAILNSLLTLLNERTFNNGKQTITTPIQSIVAATNSWPDEESLQAFGDRFLFRPTVDSLQKPSSKDKLDKWALGIKARPEVGVHLSLEDLKALQEEVHSVMIHENFIEKFSNVCELLDQRNIRISDRRRVQILKFLRAWALVQGDDMIFPEHLHGSLVHIVYQTEEDKSTVQEVVDQEVPSASKIFGDGKRAAAALMNDFMAERSKLANTDRGLGTLNDFVQNLERSYKDICVVYNKINEILDSNRIKLTAAERSRGVKLLQQIEAHKQTMAFSLSEIKGK
jgi:MoxR-like ATPase